MDEPEARTPMTIHHPDQWGWEAFTRLVRNVLTGAAHEVAEVELRPEHHVGLDLGLDSVDVLVLLAQLEERVGVVLPPLEFEPTLADLYDLVTGQLSP